MAKWTISTFQMIAILARMPAALPTRLSRAGALLAAVWLLTGAELLMAAESKPPTPSPLQTAGKTYTGSKSCRECHERFYELWSTSFHGLALQPWTQDLAKKLKPQTNAIVAGKYSFKADIEQGTVTETGPAGTNVYRITQATGGKDVFYFLAALDHGWLQTLPTAYDVRHQQWFDTTASAVRHFGDQLDEALYWKERPLTFNTSCHSCHVSQFEKNYDVKSDSYHTTWAEPGINCETCHGPGEEHVKLFRNAPTNQPPPADLKLILARKLSTSQRNDMCAPCHARMSPITPSFSPGQRYFDHFDLVTLENRDFYPDGRDLGENYTFTLWRMNPCAISGKLDCIHCHTSSGRYRFREASAANQACMPCHQKNVENAPAHTHHAQGSRGNECISCHMPMTEFARMRRSDHSMRPPAPAATLRFGSPNACNLCHTNQTAAWADAQVRAWRKRDYQKPILEVGELVDAARKSLWTKLPELLAYIESAGRGEIPAASIVRLLINCPDHAAWRPVLRRLALKDPSPLVRAAAVDTLGSHIDTPEIETLAAAVCDDYRLVRVRAAAALAPVPEDQLPRTSIEKVRAATAEFMQAMQSVPDDMAAHYNFGNYYMGRGDMEKALGEFQLASRIQPSAVPPYANVALVYNALGQNDKAEASLKKALSLEPTNASVNLNLGMLMAEMRRIPEAEQALRTAIKSDPKLAQAAYNLALLVSSDRPDEALQWATKAATLRPEEPRYTYALALFQHRAGKEEQAAALLKKSLAANPAHPESYALLGQIYERLNQPSKAAEVYRQAAGNSALPEEIRAAFQQRVEVLK